MLNQINSWVHRIQSNNVQEVTNNDKYLKLVAQINKIDYSKDKDEVLTSISQGLKKRALKGESLDNLLIEAYGLVKEVTKRLLGITPNDMQLLGAIALHQGKIIEMQTGEGKTLVAVFAAYLNALTDKGVQVLTFNDYLAQRDAQWMGPIYHLLGLSCTYIQEGMPTEERKKRYLAHITYVTAKESGFDYLRDFLAIDSRDIVHRDFNYAIIDEADSIMIDEARVPLVISGLRDEETFDYQELVEVVRALKQDEDYGLDEHGENVILQDNGLEKIERLLGCGNIYENTNLNLLARLNCMLHAIILLHNGRDYIVADGEIKIIDQLTGRIAEKSHWPENLHWAVEAKEGLISKPRGLILNSIPLQYFINLFPKLAGMTGTAKKATHEFQRMYNLDVVTVPPNKPCIRIDHPPMLYTHLEAKVKGVIDEIRRIHEIGQPVLIGTSSVEESEGLVARLAEHGLKANLLNAKNDWDEAIIIAQAGKYGAITVSTNMAGRGVDIKLGGENEDDSKRVKAAGGLYVIGTGLQESSRVADQLRGRAGRQGDPGESRYFLSLEDDILIKYQFKKLLTAKQTPDRQMGSINSPIILDKIMHIQRVIEGYNTDIRRQLWSYSEIIEEQRKIIYHKRNQTLKGELSLTLLIENCPGVYKKYIEEFGEEILAKVEKQLTLLEINKCWADYLDYISSVKEGIHLMVIGGENPLHHFNLAAVEGFNQMLEDIDERVVKSFIEVRITEDGINLEEQGLVTPGSTWAYIMNDSQEQFSRLPFIINSTSNYVKGALFSLSSIFNKSKTSR